MTATTPDAERDAQREQLARNALERVCSGMSEDAALYYGSSFVDHVNDHEFHGLSGVERSGSVSETV